MIGVKSFCTLYGTLLYKFGTIAYGVPAPSNVYPSAFDFATISVPIMLPAPVRLSITTCWPSTSGSFDATMRMSTSVEPPAPNGITTRIGLVG